MATRIHNIVSLRLLSGLTDYDELNRDDAAQGLPTLHKPTGWC
jgi:hypothetical protein